VLLAYGAADRTVPLVHGQQLHEALRERGAPVEWTLFEDEGHGWALEPNRIAFATAVARFLDRHVGPGRAGAAR
jgi:dipeptidyl aminopeptidase/acylaminoacyl peptidase